MQNLECCLSRFASQWVTDCPPLMLTGHDDAMQGVEFLVSNSEKSLKFLNFMQHVVPMRYRSDKQLVSHNEHSSTYNYKYTFSVEIVPICRVSS